MYFKFDEDNTKFKMGQLCFGPSWVQKLSFDPYKFTI